MTSVLVTGAGGFIGSHLAEDQLRRGHRVRALDVNLDRLNHLGPSQDLDKLAGDVRDPELLRRAVDGVDTVLHLASAHLELTEGAEYFESINVGAVTKLIDAAAQAGVRRLVHCSSVGVYGPLSEIPANESSPCNPDILYEMTKLAGESAVLEGLDRTGLDAVIVRPAWVYGHRCPRTLKLFRSIARKRFVFVGRGQNLRHPIYIQDMCDAFDLAASASSVQGEIFIIAGDSALPVKELVEEICAVVGVNSPAIQVPLTAMMPVCWSMEAVGKLLGREPPFSTRSLKFFTENSAFVIDKAKDKLGFTPRIGLRQGLELTFSQFTSMGLL